MAMEQDWQMMADIDGKTNNRDGGKPNRMPKKDMVIKDGDTLDFGGQHLIFHWTPGHTPGVTTTEGVVRKGAKVRILRDNVVIQEMGTLTTLKRFKDEVNEVIVGQECGMSFGQFQDIKQGDFIECFSLEVVQRSL